MIGNLIRFLRKKARARIAAKLDALYADMREVDELTQRAKNDIDRHHKAYKAKLERKEKALIAEAKRLDKQDSKRLIPSFTARA